MNIAVLFLLSVFTVAHCLNTTCPACEQLRVLLESDQTSVRVPVNSEAVLKCCYKRVPAINVRSVWVMRYNAKNITNSSRALMEEVPGSEAEAVCQKLTLKEVQLNDTGMYQCYLSKDKDKCCQFTHGTYLQVYTPLRRTLDISESLKNSIITMEGVLLLFSVLIPGLCQLGKTKRINMLERKKHREEENIYEGLNLDDCNSTYHQITRSHMHGPYQDVANVAEDDIQLEKP